jgi:hypothetical protein
MWDLFFDARSPAAGQANVVGRPIAQFVLEFVAASPDGLRMQAGDLGDALEPAMSQTLGLAGRDPATLLFIQPTQQHIELPMIVPFPMVTRQTGRTTTIVDRQFR